MAPWIKVMLDGGGLELGSLMSVQAVEGMVAALLLAGFAQQVSAVRLLGWGGLPFTAWGTAQMLLLQTESEPELRGRIFGAYFALFGGAQFVGMALSGILGDWAGVLVINVDAVTYLLAGMLALGYALRHPGGGLGKRYREQSLGGGSARPVPDKPARRQSQPTTCRFPTSPTVSLL
ncbi:hypothetical protein HNQ09_002104 [Deinococcus budaensis]|uniref:MFS transporter n=1 Tax=Deinococcus budaensis TaxID=1665626 RepID=A0A7W8GGD5_9DEIO|nr:hypothetical protein [Deinococcus budaensis]MBB5234661.1 hypothetical protein [Deinococcus budaensis]